MDIEREFLDLPRVDGKLRLVFSRTGPVSPPDSTVPGYWFNMLQHGTDILMGRINIKAGHTENIVRYRGHLGFEVFEQWRGNHYSARSCLLLVPILRQLQLNTVWLTCNVDNYASRNNIERIGAVYRETVTIPPSYPHIGYYPDHARKKMRFCWELS